MLCRVIPLKFLALSNSNARDSGVHRLAHRFDGGSGLQLYQRAMPRLVVAQAPRCIIVGTKMSVTVPVSVPVKDSGPTPTISYGARPCGRRAPRRAHRVRSAGANSRMKSPRKGALPVCDRHSP